MRETEDQNDTYPQELLSARDDVSDDESRAQRVNNVLVVRVQHEAINNLTYEEVSIGRLRRAAVSLTLEADDGLQFEVLFDDLFHWLYLDSIIIAGGGGTLFGEVANVLMRLIAIESAVLLAFV